SPKLSIHEGSLINHSLGINTEGKLRRMVGRDQSAIARSRRSVFDVGGDYRIYVDRLFQSREIRFHYKDKLTFRLRFNPSSNLVLREKTLLSGQERTN